MADRPDEGPATSSSATITRSRMSATWSAPWRALDDELRNELEKRKLNHPVIFSGCFDNDSGLRGALRDLLRDLGLEGTTELTELRLNLLTDLRFGAEAPATVANGQMALTSDYQLSDDLFARRQHEARQQKEGTRTAAQAEHLAGLPSQWRGKRYRRQEVAKNPQEREEAEEAKLAHWTKEVLGLLLEADLPFAASARQARGGLEGPSSLRCCRGLRANTLKKRVDGWRPFRRWLVSEGLGFYPTSPQQVLDYLDVQWEASAPRTFYQDFQDSLTFFEQAGEVPEDARLSTNQGVRNAVKALAAKRAQQRTQAEREAPKGEKQAPPLLLAQVAGLERVVVNPDLPLYQRFYAWAKLLRHWSSMRWDDSMGINPGDLQRRARGLFGLLQRSKTSGPDKAVKVLPFFVSNEAWVTEKHWLFQGHELLSTELGFQRDYLVPLPNSDLSGTCGLRAQYSDALGLTRELLARLPQPDEPSNRLLLEVATRFWSEHSDRAGCSGWLASLGVSSDKRGFLGRWAVASTADHYVRVAVRVVENLQVLAARAARKSFLKGPDFFGEEAVLEELRAFLLSKGVHADETNEQVRVLTSADAALAIPFDPKAGLLEEEAQAEEKDHENAQVDEAPVEGEELHALRLDEIPLKPEILAQQRAEEEQPPRGFCIAVTNRRVRRLHFIGNCGKVPGEHYKVFECWGDLLPPEHEIDVLCDICFRGNKALLVKRPPAQDKPAEELAVATSSSSSSSSGSSSSEEAAPQAGTPKKAKAK